MATEIMLIREHADDIMIKEELGINPEKLKGSAMEAAIYSFILFVIGAVIPLLPTGAGVRYCAFLLLSFNQAIFSRWKIRNSLRLES